MKPRPSSANVPGSGTTLLTGLNRRVQACAVVALLLRQELIVDRGATVGRKAQQVERVEHAAHVEAVRSREEGHDHRVRATVDIDALEIGAAVRAGIEVVGRLVVREMEDEVLESDVRPVDLDVKGDLQIDPGDRIRQNGLVDVREGPDEERAGIRRDVLHDGNRRRRGQVQVVTALTRPRVDAPADLRVVARAGIAEVGRAAALVEPCATEEIHLDDCAGRQRRKRRGSCYDQNLRERA